MIPSRAATQARLPITLPGVWPSLPASTSHAEQAKAEAEPLAGGYALPQEDARERRGKQRLEPDYHRRHTGLDAHGDADKHAAEIVAVDEQPRDRIMPHLARPLRPRRTCRQRHQNEQSRGQAVTQSQDDQRFRMGKAEPRTDEAGAPPQHEHGRDADSQAQAGPRWIARYLAHRAVAYMLMARTNRTPQSASGLVVPSPRRSCITATPRSRRPVLVARSRGRTGPSARLRAAAIDLLQTLGWQRSAPTSDAQG